MLFQSADFVIFFFFSVLVFRFLPGKFRRNWLLLCSLFFYLGFDVRFLLVLAPVIGIGFLSGLWMEHAKKTSARKRRFVGSVVLLVLILVVFKYTGFLLENVNALLTALGQKPIASDFSLMLPIGISFYLFQTIGYLADVFHGKISAERSFPDYALFISFFPQITAGPIARADRLLPQIRRLPEAEKPSYLHISSGFSLMLWGFFMKMVISDRAGIFVDNIWQNLFTCGTVETVIAALAFSLQIYADFAGYSAIAIGAARILGLELDTNFRTPYFAESIAGFWRRWHISLSTWLRDYIYIPLGGSRCSRIRKYRNVMITFLVSGIWHGASWSFVIWGGLHGLYQILGDLLKPLRRKLCIRTGIRENTFSFRLGRILWTFLLTSFAWIFFRAGSLSNAIYFLNRMFTRWDPWVLFNEDIYAFGLVHLEFNILTLGTLLLLAFDLISARKKRDFGELLSAQSLWLRWLVCLFLILSVLLLGEYGIDFSSGQFIYAGF